MHKAVEKTNIAIIINRRNNWKIYNFFSSILYMTYRLLHSMLKDCSIKRIDQVKISIQKFLSMNRNILAIFCGALYMIYRIYAYQEIGEKIVIFKNACHT